MVFFLELVATGVRAFKLFRFVHHRDDEITKLKLRYIADIFDRLLPSRTGADGNYVSFILISIQLSCLNLIAKKSANNCRYLY